MSWTTPTPLRHTILLGTLLLGIVAGRVAQAAEQQISGSLFFFDERDADLVPFPLPDDNYRPLANVPYSIVIKQGGQQKILGYGITHTNGAIIHTLEIQQAKATPATLSLVFALKNSQWQMQDVFGKPYLMKSAALPFNPTQDGILDFGAMAPVYGTLTHQAAHVFTSVAEAWMYASDAGWTQGDPVTVIWPNYQVNNGKLVTDANGNPQPDGMSNATAKTIRINFGKWLTDHGTIYHEYGHVVQQRIVTLSNPGYCWGESQAPDYEDGDGCWHNNNSQEYPGASFIEGWANFIQYGIANYVLPEYNDNAFKVYQQAESRSINPLDDTNEANVAAVLVDLLDTRVDSHGEETEHFQLKPITTDGKTWYYYDFWQTLPAGKDEIEWTVAGLLGVLAHVSGGASPPTIGIKEYLAELRVLCDEHGWECADTAWDDRFGQLTRTSWVNLAEDTAPTPYPW